MIASGRLLILKPTYKSGWTIPGGIMEADGETPWQACQREVREECGLEVTRGRLACMDFRRWRDGNPGGIRFLFDCGALADSALARVVLQPEEISEHRLAPLAEALSLLRRADPPSCPARCASAMAHPASTPSSTWRTAAASARYARRSEAAGS